MAAMVGAKQGQVPVMRSVFRAFSISAAIALAALNLSFAAFAQTIPAATDKSTTAMLEGVSRGEYSAILEAGRAGDTNLIPYLQAQITGTPSDPSTEAATMALAKLGVKKYLDAVVSQFAPTNSALFAAYQSGQPVGSSDPTVMHVANYHALASAFEKLAYIRNRSTVKIVAAFLYNTEHFQFAPDVPPSWPSSAAARALQQMVENPPVLPAVCTGEEEHRVWQQWWEQNKDKYP
jgi:hypothetical protein